MLSISKSSRSPRTLSFDLRKEVEAVTSHLTWLEECVPFIEESAIELAPDPTMKGYIKLLLEHAKLEDEAKYTRKEEEDEEEDPRSEATIGFIAMKTNSCTMKAYASQFESAREELCETRGHLKLISDPGHQKMLEYLLDALEWAIGILEASEQGKAEEAVGVEHFEKVAALRSRWEEMKPDLDKTKAVVTILKGCLASALKVKSTKVLEYFVQATKLDPSCYLWYHYAYRKSRQIRRDKKVKGQPLPSPGGEEIRLCKAAYKWRPKGDNLATFDYAILLKESLWFEPREIWETKEKDYVLCQQLLEEALSITTQTNKIVAIKVKVHLAELLLFGKGRKLDREKGRRLLLECEKEFPKNSQILHKIGKLYHNGVRVAGKPGKWKNPKLAEKFYKRAVENEAGNFPCLMDYLHLLEEQKEYGSMLEVINRALEFGKRDCNVVRLHAKKGSALMSLYFADQVRDSKYLRLACESWIHVMENYPESDVEVFRAIYDKSHVISILEDMQSRQEYKSKEGIIANFVKELKKKISEEKRVGSFAQDVHRGGRPGPKPLVQDRSGATFQMKSGKGKGGIIRN